MHIAGENHDKLTLYILLYFKNIFNFLKNYLKCIECLALPFSKKYFLDKRKNNSFELFHFY